MMTSSTNNNNRKDCVVDEKDKDLQSMLSNESVTGSVMSQQTRFSFYNAQEIQTTTATATTQGGATVQQGNANTSKSANADANKSNPILNSREQEENREAEEKNEYDINNYYENTNHSSSGSLNNSKSKRFNFYNADEVKLTHTVVQTVEALEAKAKTRSSSSNDSVNSNSNNSNSNINKLMTRSNPSSSSLNNNINNNNNNTMNNSTTSINSSNKSTNLDSTEILKSLQEHEQQRLEILKGPRQTPIATSNSNSNNINNLPTPSSTMMMMSSPTKTTSPYIKSSPNRRFNTTTREYTATNERSDYSINSSYNNNNNTNTSIDTATLTPGGSNSNNNNPYEDAIKEALHLIRKHRSSSNNRNNRVPTLPTSTTSATGTTTTSRTTAGVRPQHIFTNQYINTPTSTTNNDQTTTTTSTLQQELPVHHNFLISPPYSNPYTSSTTNNNNNNNNTQPPTSTTSAMTTTTTATPDNIYTKEIEARRKERQQRLAFYATRLAQLKHEEEQDNIHIHSGTTPSTTTTIRKQQEKPKLNISGTSNDEHYNNNDNDDQQNIVVNDLTIARGHKREQNFWTTSSPHYKNNKDEKDKDDDDDNENIHRHTNNEGLDHHDEYDEYYQKSTSTMNGEGLSCSVSTLSNHNNNHNNNNNIDENDNDSTNNVEDNVQQGVERVLLAILERANSSRERNYNITSTTSTTSNTNNNNTTINTSSNNTSGISAAEEKKANDEYYDNHHRITNTTATNNNDEDDDDVLLRTMTDILGSVCTTNTNNSPGDGGGGVTSCVENRFGALDCQNSKSNNSDDYNNNNYNDHYDADADDPSASFATQEENITEHRHHNSRHLYNNNSSSSHSNEDHCIRYARSDGSGSSAIQQQDHDELDFMVEQVYGQTPSSSSSHHNNIHIDNSATNNHLLVGKTSSDSVTQQNMIASDDVLAPPPQPSSSVDAILVDDISDEEEEEGTMTNSEKDDTLHTDEGEEGTEVDNSYEEDDEDEISDQEYQSSRRKQKYRESLGPLNKRSGGTTGVVLEDDSSVSASSAGPSSSSSIASSDSSSSLSEEEDHHRQSSMKSVTSPTILQSLSAAVSMVTGGGRSYDDTVSSKQERYAVDVTEDDDKYLSDHDREVVDVEANDLMRSLCAHILPIGVNEIHGRNGSSSRILDTVPEWDESDPDEAGYRIVRLTSQQLRRIEREYDHMVERLKRKSLLTHTHTSSADESAFERDLRAAEDLLDEEEKKRAAASNNVPYKKKSSSSNSSSSSHHDSQKSITEGDDKEEIIVDTSLLDQQQQLSAFPGIKPAGKGEMGDLEFFLLPVIFKSHVTGFEPTKDLILEPGNVVAGQFLVEGVLGSAAFSTAYRCIDLNSEEDSSGCQDEVCLKVIKNTKDFVDQSMDEIKILELLRQTGKCHENNIVEMQTFFYYREHLIIVTELLRQNLFEFGKFILESGEEPYFTMVRLAYITRQCLIALNFVHSLGLVHSDVKPENILLASYSRAKVKLIDFGSSCYLTDRQSSYIQSRSYRAPEVVLGLPYNGKIDVWSLGCVIAEMFTGEVTFQNDSIVSMLSRIEALCGAFPRHMITQGRVASRFFTKCGLLYEKVEDDSRNHSSYTGTEDDSSDESHRSRNNHIDIFQPKRTTLSARLGFPQDLMDRFDGGKTLSREEKRQALFVDLIRKLLTIDPEARPTAAEALEHPFMKYAATLTETDVKYPSE